MYGSKLSPYIAQRVYFKYFIWNFPQLADGKVLHEYFEMP